MSAGEGVALVRYQGQRLRRPAIAAAGSQEIAYQVIIRDWIRSKHSALIVGRGLKAAPTWLMVSI